MKYLNKFSTISQYNTAKQEEFELPHVSLIDETKEIKYDPYTPLFRLTNEGNIISTISLSTAENPNLLYKTNLNNTWTSWDYSEIEIPVGGYIEFKAGEDNMGVTGQEGHGFTITGNNIVGSGSIMSLLYKTLTIDNNLILPNYNWCFNELFKNCTSLITAPELPATNLTEGCYASMFYGCINLTAAPELPATTLAVSCYNSMFRGCTSLTAAPELPAVSIPNNGYQSMFYGCTNLSSAPELNATSAGASAFKTMFAYCTSITSSPVINVSRLNSYTCESMFEGCSSIETAGEIKSVHTEHCACAKMFKNCTSLINLPTLSFTGFGGNGDLLEMFAGCSSLVSVPSNYLNVRTLPAQCYSNMFNGCTSLVDAPNLPATGVPSSCYMGMFNGCTSLVTAPQLPAKSLGGDCYYAMFKGCTSLISPPELPATTLSDFCYTDMFRGCISLQEAPYLPALVLKLACYNGMFNGCTNLKFIKADFTTTITSSTQYTLGWVSGVASVGEFIKNPEATWDLIGTNGIPTGWYVATDRTLVYHNGSDESVGSFLWAMKKSRSLNLNKLGLVNSLIDVTEEGDIINIDKETYSNTSYYGNDHTTLSTSFYAQGSRYTLFCGEWHNFILTRNSEGLQPEGPLGSRNAKFYNCELYGFKRLGGNYNGAWLNTEFHECWIHDNPDLGEYGYGFHTGAKLYKCIVETSQLGFYFHPYFEDCLIRNVSCRIGANPTMVRCTWIQETNTNMAAYGNYTNCTIIGVGLCRQGGTSQLTGGPTKIINCTVCYPNNFPGINKYDAYGNISGVYEFTNNILINGKFTILTPTERYNYLRLGPSSNNVYVGATDYNLTDDGFVYGGNDPTQYLDMSELVSFDALHKYYTPQNSAIGACTDNIPESDIRGYIRSQVASCLGCMATEASAPSL